ncbi:MAG TPA: peptidoglycan-binding domain-containing protein [Gemmatimonadales bacterium]
MLPFVCNDDPERLVQITMTGSVGTGGRNDLADVRLVQTLLNVVPAHEAGPQAKLAVDGIAGPKTVAAIRRFQQAHTKVVDGRVDASGPTIVKLVQLLHARDQLPRGLPNLGAPDERIARGLNGQGMRAPPLRNVPVPGGRAIAGVTLDREDPLGPGINYDPNQPMQPLNWEIVSSGSLDFTIGPLGIAAMNIYMVEDGSPGRRLTFKWSGIGSGLSVFPLGMNLSFADFPSWGSRLRKGIFGRNPCPKEDFSAPATIYTVGGAAPGVGWTGAVILFGCYGPFWFSTRAFAALTGPQWGTPNAAFTGYYGFMMA